MADTLVALEQLNSHVAKFATLLNRSRGKFVEPRRVRKLALTIAQTYFTSVHAELAATEPRRGLPEEIEFTVSAILQLTSNVREKIAYVGQLNELRPFLQEAMVAVMKAGGIRRLVLSDTEKGILSTLVKLLPSTAVSYEQALRDIAGGQRISWRGPAAELREVLREVVDHFAPDEQVMAAPGFQLEKGLMKPTQKQKIRFILKARNTNSAATTTATDALDTFENGIATLGRSTYQRGRRPPMCRPTRLKSANSRDTSMRSLWNYFTLRDPLGAPRTRDVGACWATARRAGGRARLRLAGQPRATARRPET